MVKGWLLKEIEEGEPINWQDKYQKLIAWYNIFEEAGYINYERNDEQNNNRVENKNSQSNNLYFSRKNDLRENWKFRKEMFYNIKTTSINKINKDMIVLGSRATNRVCPFKELCINIREEENAMDCGKGNKMSSKLVGDMLIKGRDKI